MMGIANAGGAGGVVPFVSDIEIIQNVSSGVAQAGLQFNYPTGGLGTEDARVLTRRNTAVFTDMGLDNAAVPVDHTGEWTSAVITPSEWEVACVSEDVGSWDISAAVVGVYVNLSTLGTSTIFKWSERRLGGKGYSPGTNTVTASFRLREVAVPGNFTDFQVICTAIQT